MNNKKNLEITVTCKELEIESRSEHYSGQIEKLIKKAKRPKEKAKITCSDSGIINIMYELWEAQLLEPPGRKGIESLGKFIHDTFLIPGKMKSKKWMSLSAIKSELYRLKS